MGALWQDLKYAARMLRKNPGFTAVTVLTLALGIGATTAIFSVVYAVLLRPLPYREPSSLVWIGELWPQLKGQAFVPNPDYQYWRTQSQSFEDVEGYAGGGSYALTGNGEPVRISGALITAGFFHLLGTEPFQGRSFLSEEDRRGAQRAVILSYGLWQRLFGSDPNILGKAITLDDQPYAVVGVMPAAFQFPDKTVKPELFIPYALPPPDWGAKNLNMFSTIGRLKDHATIEQARAELFAISQQHSSEMPPAFSHMRDGMQVVVTTLHERLVGDVRTSLLVLLGAVALVLLIACANIANLQLVRTVERRTEFAVRAAVGADRGTLIRQLLTEGVLLAGLGGAAGLLLAISATGFLRTYVPANISLAGNISIDRWVLVFALAITCFTGILFGMAPAIGSSKLDVNAVLKEGGVHGGGHGRWGTRGVLVVAELALAVMLLAGSGLLIRSFVLLSGVRLGMDPSNLLTAGTSLPMTKYSQPQQRQAFFDQVLARLKSLPGVQSVASTSALPLTQYTLSTSLAIDGQSSSPPGLGPYVPIEYISPDYFHTLRIPLLEGRFFAGDDSTGAVPVTIVNAAFARRFFADEDAIGKRIRFGDQTGPWVPIVGLVGDVRHSGPGEETEPGIYIPYGAEDPTTPRYSQFVIRVTGDPLALAPAVRAQVESVDPEQPISDVATMEQRLSDTLDAPRFNALLLGAFACLALVLAAVGIFGVIAYFVSQRTHEIGIRVALGASPANVLRLIMCQGLVMTLMGLGLGLAGSMVLTRYLASLLFEIRPRDPLTFAGVAVLLVLIALAACYIPARRAMRVDPMVALRHE